MLNQNNRLSAIALKMVRSRPGVSVTELDKLGSVAMSGLLKRPGLSDLPIRCLKNYMITMQKILLSLLALLLILEEWLWDVLSLIGHYLIRLLNWEAYEQWLIQSSPRQALLVFLLPVALVTPLNLLAFGLMAHGLLVQGVLLELLAKLLGTLVISRIFTLTKPQLLTYRLLNRIYSTIKRWLHWAHHKVVATAVYQRAQALKKQIRSYLYQQPQD